jgi:hypothetical protein
MSTIKFDFSSQDVTILQRHQDFLQASGQVDLDVLTTFLADEEFYDQDNVHLFLPEDCTDVQDQEFIEQLRVYVEQLVNK